MTSWGATSVRSPPRCPEAPQRMSHSLDTAIHRISWHGRAFVAGLLLVSLLVPAAVAPASLFAPLREQGVPGVSSMLAPSVTSGHAALSFDSQPPSLAPVDLAQAVTTGDPEPGIGLISAVYNSI